jgi:Fe-S cluster assembly ATP-binding protein
MVHVKSEENGVSLIGPWEYLGFGFPKDRKVRNVLLKLCALTLKRDERTILWKVDLTVKAGEIYAILGPNGAGKSSLAYAIMGCGDYKVDEGKIIFEGNEINNMPVWERAKLGITLMWQEPARFEGIIVEDYLLLGSKTKYSKDVEKALQGVLLEPERYLKRKVDGKLSGGERKRVELAAISVMKPKMAILDEPDSGIDILVFDRILEFIKELKESGTTVIIITHHADVSRIAQRAALIGEGRLVMEGSSDEVVEYFESKCMVCPKFR